MGASVFLVSPFVGSALLWVSQNVNEPRLRTVLTVTPPSSNGVTKTSTSPSSSEPSSPGCLPEVSFHLMYVPSHLPSLSFAVHVGTSSLGKATVSSSRLPAAVRGGRQTVQMANGEVEYEVAFEGRELFRNELAMAAGSR